MKQSEVAQPIFDGELDAQRVRTAQWQVVGLTDAMHNEPDPVRRAELCTKRDSYAALLTPAQLADCMPVLQ